MSIDKITDPASVPAAVADYQAQNTHLDRLLGNAVVPFPIDGTDIKKGSLFNIGGDMFYTSSDTAITGSASDYVKLTPGASVAVPTYVANLSGVTWNDAYNGYYDVGGNLYVFDEAQALVGAELAILYSRLGRFFETWIGQALKPADGPSFTNLIITNGLNIGSGLIRTKKIAIGNWDMQGTSSISIAHGLGANYLKILNINAMILDDAGTELYKLSGHFNFTEVDGGIGEINITNILLVRDTNGVFNSTLFNDPAFDRGWIYITYEL